MPASRRTRFERPKRRNVSTTAGVVADPEAGLVPGAEHLPSVIATINAERSMLQDIALDLWLPSYEERFTKELEDNRVRAHDRGILSVRSKTSAYSRRLTGQRRVAWEHRQQTRERDQLAIALHADNMRHWSPSLVARSIAYFPLTTSWMHHVESGQRRIASRPSALKVLRLMRDCRPKPEFDEGMHVAVYGFDQTYEWVGMAKRGRRQALETVDSTGMPMAITHEVYVNSIKVMLPSAFGNLSQADLQVIASNHAHLLRSVGR